MKLNEVYGITSRSVTSANDDINTMPNEVYGIAAVKDGHSMGVSSCQRWLSRIMIMSYSYIIIIHRPVAKSVQCHVHVAMPRWIQY